ncbi:hypothetical protein Tco_0039207 [Tanacetum coccineum]
MRNIMYTYLKNMGGYKHNQLKGKSYEEIQKLFDKTYKQVNSFVPIALDDKEKIEDDAEKEELRAYLDIIPGDDVAVSVESLATKYLIVDWKTHILSEDKMYYKIIRANGSTKSYKIFTEMLNDFDRQDGLDLYRLVKKEKTYPLTQEMLSRMLSGKLEVDNESEMTFELIRFTRSHIEK